MVTLKAFRFRLYPNKEQQEQLACQFGACRFVWNHYLRQRIDYYAETGEGLNYYDNSRDLTQLKRNPDYTWLREANAQSLQQSLQDLTVAYTNFFAKRARFPRFKRKKAHQSFRVPQSFRIENDHLIIPKISPIKVVVHRPVEGKMKSVTISQTPTGKYFASILCEIEMPEPEYKGGEIGIDLGLWNNRLGITADYYKMITSDLLFNAPVPAFTGATTQIQNIGEVQNEGFEFALSPKVLSGEFKWNMSANISFNRNTILKLVENDTEGNDIIYSTAPIEGAAGVETQILREGESVGVFYGYLYDGVLQEGETPLANGENVGGQKFVDLSGDSIFNADDRTIIGNPHPDFIWGWNNYFSYKNFDLNIFIQGSQGGEILNYTRMELGIMNGRHNATMDAVDRWTPENTDTDIPRADRFRKHVASDRWIEDASYIRLKNISLGYNFAPSLLDRIGIRSAMVYVSLQNFLTITKSQGVDPEVAYSYTNKNVGLDYASYPNVKSMTFGVNIGF